MKKTMNTFFIIAMFLLLVGCSQANTSSKITHYTVSFNSMGGTAVDSMQVAIGEKLDIYPQPTKEDESVFAGWYTDETYSSKFELFDDITRSTTLYASWKMPTAGLVYIENADGTASVGNNTAFSSTEVVIAKNYNGKPVKNIIDSAFKQNTSIVDVVIGSNVERIGTAAFTGCENLENVLLADSITIIEEGAFSVTGLKSVVMGSGLTALNYGVFEGSPNLKTVILGDRITSIGEAVFYDCIALETIQLGSVLTEIGEDAFLNCTSLKTILLPSNLTLIDNNAFYLCTALTTISIPSSVTTIGNSVFSSCTSLESIVVEEGNNYYKSIDGNLYTKNGEQLLQYAIGNNIAHLEIIAGIKVIADSAVKGSTVLKSITIPNSVITIENNAFSDCSSLESINIPRTVTSIGGWAFFGCSALENIYIPKEVTTMGSSVFALATNITINVELPSNEIQNWDESLQTGWRSDWNSDNRPVNWGVPNNF